MITSEEIIGIPVDNHRVKPGEGAIDPLEFGKRTNVLKASYEVSLTSEPIERRASGMDAIAVTPPAVR
jgi:hypothetical protein